ncbi:unnamed protein product [Orchesella dallaii]|uniref:C2H2-type domain-containing protein n=1 Tax=Orchesella dallaii TaxID=48710 RepID=A0ABP1QWD3_9HEXA
MDDGERIELPENISEAEVVEIVRELLGDDDMTDEELIEAFRSGMFQELCPDIEKYAEERKVAKKKAESPKPGKSDSVKPKIKQERKISEDERGKAMQDPESDRIKKCEAIKPKVKVEVMSSSSEDERRKIKQKIESVKKYGETSKPKVKIEHFSSSEDERERSREKVQVKRELLKPKHSSTSDHSRDRSRKREKKKKKVKKIVKYISSSSSSSSTSRSPTPERRKESSHPKNIVEKLPMKKDSSRKHKNSSSSDTSGGKPPKKKKRSKSTSKRNRSTSSEISRVKTLDIKNKISTHSKLNGHLSETSRDSMKKESASQSKSNNATVESSREKPPEKEKKELKPFSKYNASFSNINLSSWKPSLHREHLRYQRKWKLKPLSVVCVDMQDVPLIFHHPKDPHPHQNSVPLKPHVTVTNSRMEMFKRLERDKASAFKKKLNRKAAKFMKKYKLMQREGANKKRAKIMDRIVSSTCSNSDTSSIMIPSRKVGKLINDNHKGRGAGKMSKADRDAEARRRKIEEVKKKAEKFSARGTRVLDWEKKTEYFKSNKKKEEAAKKEKEKALAEKRRKQEQLRKERLEKQKNAPSVSFQKILACIDAANKAEAMKPKVELKIPKLSRALPPREYKPDGRINIGDVAKEVTRLLASDVKVECPVIPDELGDFGEYTVRKIAWWFLKNEKSPAPQGLFHPESHDNDGLESEHEGDFDWPSDMSSIHGCVSDPEGVYGELPPDPKKVNDADWADDYCGAASLYAKVRRVKDVEDGKHEYITLEQAEATDNFKPFLRMKPGTNYEKPNFESKCFICERKVVGQRELGAHIRSDYHKDSFRNYSLKLAAYNEAMAVPQPKKEFVAKLVEYSVNTAANTNPEKPDMAEEMKHHVAKIEPVRSDSPGPLIGGEANPANGAVEVAEMPLPDNISLPSVQDYDISSDESLMNVKVVIRTEGKWDAELEKNFRHWQDEETKIAEQYNERREYYINEPQKHKKYDEEWLAFWEKRCNELEAEGVDTDNYNFEKEWLPFWLTRVQEIMKEEVEQDVKRLKRLFGIDKEILRARFGISAEATKRQNLKKKKCKTENLSSSVNSRKKSTMTEGEVSHVSEIQRMQNQREEMEFLERKHQRQREMQGRNDYRDKELQERNRRREKEMQERKRQREEKERESTFELGLSQPAVEVEAESNFETFDQRAQMGQGAVFTPKAALDQQPEKNNQPEKHDPLRQNSKWDARDKRDHRKDDKKEKKDYYDRKDHRERDWRNYRDKYHGRKDFKDRNDHHRHRDSKDHHKGRSDHNRPHQTERRKSFHEQGNSRDTSSQPQERIDQPKPNPPERKKSVSEQENPRESRNQPQERINETRPNLPERKKSVGEQETPRESRIQPQARINQPSPNPPERRSSLYDQLENSRDDSCNRPQRPQPTVAPTPKFVYSSNVLDAVESEESVSLPTPPGTSDDVTTYQQFPRSVSCDSGKRTENDNHLSKQTIRHKPAVSDEGLDEVSPTNSASLDIECDTKNNGVSKTVDMENISSCASSLESGEVASEVSVNTKSQNCNKPQQPPVPPVISDRRPSTNVDSGLRIQTYISR